MTKFWWLLTAFLAVGYGVSVYQHGWSSQQAQTDALWVATGLLWCEICRLREKVTS